jgi:hypothetical protein
MKSLLLKKSGTLAPVQEHKLPSLAVCIVMDLLGHASFAIPILGELLDFIWAPVSALIYMKMFGFKKGLFGGIFNFVEEILPGLDIIPTFTITWFIHYFRRGRETYTITPITR